MPAQLYKVLSLTGGYRGYYTISVVNALEKLGNLAINNKCDLFAGTSVGGIVALGLASGLSSQKIMEGFKSHGNDIFPKSYRRNLSWVLCKYSSKKLKGAITNILGKDICEMKISDLPREVLVTSVCLQTGETCLISGIDSQYREWRVIDAALATSAAPTFFAPHQINKSKYVDGGLSSNVPDIAAFSFVLDKLKKDPDEIQMLSIGTLHSTADTTSYKNIRASAGEATWGRKIVDVVLDSQRNAVLNQCEQLLPKARYFRIDRQIDSAPELDEVSETLRSKFVEYADEDATAAFKSAIVKSILI